MPVAGEGRSRGRRQTGEPTTTRAQTGGPPSPQSATGFAAAVGSPTVSLTQRSRRKAKAPGLTPGGSLGVRTFNTRTRKGPIAKMKRGHRTGGLRQGQGWGHFWRLVPTMVPTSHFAGALPSATDSRIGPGSRAGVGSRTPDLLITSQQLRKDTPGHLMTTTTILPALDRDCSHFVVTYENI